jgi:hypothetical protein
MSRLLYNFSQFMVSAAEAGDWEDVGSLLKTVKIIFEVGADAEDWTYACRFLEKVEASLRAADPPQKELLRLLDDLLAVQPTLLQPRDVE